MSVTKTVTVTVNDVNDVAPSFDSGAAGISIDENASAGTVVYDANATPDVDGQAVVYSLVEGVGDAAFFRIDDNTGVVTLRENAAIDHETKASYSFTVRATVGTQFADQMVTGTINDVFDEVPTFANEGTHTVNVDENKDARDEIYRPTVTADMDGARLTYSIGGADVGAFDFDTSTGAISFMNSPDYENPGSVDGNNVYNITITVTATHNGVSLSNTQAVTVRVGDVPEAAAPPPQQPVALDYQGMRVFTKASTAAAGSTPPVLEPGYIKNWDIYPHSPNSASQMARDEQGDAIQNMYFTEIVQLDNEGNPMDTTSGSPRLIFSPLAGDYQNRNTSTQNDDDGTNWFEVPLDNGSYTSGLVDIETYTPQPNQAGNTVAVVDVHGGRTLGLFVSAIGKVNALSLLTHFDGLAFVADEAGIYRVAYVLRDAGMQPNFTGGWNPNYGASSELSEVQYLTIIVGIYDEHDGTALLRQVLDGSEGSYDRDWFKIGNHADEYNAVHPAGSLANADIIRNFDRAEGDMITLYNLLPKSTGRSTNLGGGRERGVWPAGR